MGWKTNNLWFNSQHEQISPHLPPFQVVRLALGPTQLPIQQVLGAVYPEQRRESYRCAQVNNGWNYTITPSLLACLPVQRVWHLKRLEPLYTFHFQWRGISRALLQTCVNIYSFLVYLMMLSTGNIICHITVRKVKWKDVYATVVSSEILSKYLPRGITSNNEEKILSG